MTQCKRCHGAKASIREMQSEIVNMLRVAEKHPGTLGGKNSLARIPVLKERLRESRDLLKEHVLADHGAGVPS